MTEPFKLCPICETPNHRNAAVCTTCGTTLSDVPVYAEGAAPPAEDEVVYDFRYGETDLYEGAMRRKGRLYLAVIAILLGLVMCAGAALVVVPLLPTLSGQDDTQEQEPAAALMITNTPRPTIIFPTVTQGSPTQTPSITPSNTPTITTTPTREPCYQTVPAGEGLYALVALCGHRHLDVVDIVVDINNLNDETDIREGQVIEIPWPTDTPDPDPEPEAETGGDADSSESTAPDTITVGLSQEDVLATQLVDPFFQPTATNPPGIGTHRVQTGENIITIGLQYDTSIEVLEQLNPEITFSQCDFGERFGGERCIVFLNAGQTIRVPQPTPTPTLSPTPNGSETPTPTATPTFNAPFASSPSNRAYFRRDELVTLRWTSTGVLGPDDMYRVAVENITSDETYTIETSDLFFVIPREWQSDEPGRYEYAWTIGIVSSDAPDNPRFPTEERRFSWEGLGETDDDS